MGNIIMLFNGDISEIPKKWIVCDGNNNTPDLREKFIKGAINSTDIATIGGSETHTHPNTSLGGNAHTHSCSSSGSHKHDSTSGSKVGGNMDSYLDYDSHSHSVSSSVSSHTHSVGQGSNIPPYYKLIFIMGEKYLFDFPIGSIVMFNGTIEEIPQGWEFCNGLNGTPDLRNQFIKGAVTFGEIGDKKDTDTHTHTTNNGGEHTHGSTTASFRHTHGTKTSGGYMLSRNPHWGISYSGSSHTHSLSSSGSHSHSISSPFTSTEPVHYKLAYIKRIS